MPRVTKQQLISLQKKFKTDARIGEEFGITRQAIHHLRIQYGIESRRAANPERNQKILEMRKSGASVEKTAKKFNLSVPQTYRIIKETAAPKKSAIKNAAKSVKRPRKK